MTRSIAILVVAGALAGCASTPGEMRELGAKDVVPFAGDRREVAECTAVGIEDRVMSQNVIRQLADKTYLLGSSQGYNLWTVDFVDAEARIYISDNALMSETLTRHIREAIESCTRV